MCQCTPCREGTGWLYRMLTRIVEGNGTYEDIDKLDDVASKIEGRTICALGDAAAMPVRSFINIIVTNLNIMLNIKTAWLRWRNV